MKSRFFILVLILCMAKSLSQPNVTCREKFFASSDNLGQLNFACSRINGLPYQVWVDTSIYFNTNNLQILKGTTPQYVKTSNLKLNKKYYYKAVFGEHGTTDQWTDVDSVYTAVMNFESKTKDIREGLEFSLPFASIDFKNAYSRTNAWIQIEYDTSIKFNSPVYRLFDNNVKDTFHFLNAKHKQKFYLRTKTVFNGETYGPYVIPCLNNFEFISLNPKCDTASNFKSKLSGSYYLSLHYLLLPENNDHYFKCKVDFGNNFIDTFTNDYALNAIRPKFEISDTNDIKVNYQYYKKSTNTLLFSDTISYAHWKLIPANNPSPNELHNFIYNPNSCLNKIHIYTYSDSNMKIILDSVITNKQDDIQKLLDQLNFQKGHVLSYAYERFGKLSDRKIITLRDYKYTFDPATQYLFTYLSYDSAVATFKYIRSGVPIIEGSKIEVWVDNNRDFNSSKLVKYFFKDSNYFSVPKITGRYNYLKIRIINSKYNTVSNWSYIRQIHSTGIKTGNGNCLIYYPNVSFIPSMLLGEKDLIECKFGLSSKLHMKDTIIFDAYQSGIVKPKFNLTENDSIFFQMRVNRNGELGSWGALTSCVYVASACDQPKIIGSTYKSPNDTFTLFFHDPIPNRSKIIKLLFSDKTPNVNANILVTGNRYIVEDVELAQFGYASIISECSTLNNDPNLLNKITWTLLNTTLSTNSNVYPSYRKDYFANNNSFINQHKALIKLSIFNIDGRLVFEVIAKENIELNQLIQGQIYFYIVNELESGKRVTGKFLYEKD